MEQIHIKAEKFISELPYRQGQFAGRNWGHPWHSLCSYHGKLKPSIAHFLISTFTSPGDIVLDPLCGVGTIPFEASLQGRIGIGNDLSELAYCVSKAKLERVEYSKIEQELNKLEIYILSETNKMNYDNAPYKDFGLNNTLKDYFHSETYCEIIAARKYFVESFNELTPAKAIILSALLHILHGNRPYALSRRSHPLTPYAPKGDFVYKNVIKHIKDKLNRAYKCDEFGTFISGQAIKGDFSNLRNIKANVIITSPPFADSFKFYNQNWMRLWMCGWEPDDFKSAVGDFIDKKQNSSFDIYTDFFEMCYNNIVDEGLVILHLGKTKKVDMAAELYQKAKDKFELVYLGEENVNDIEKHGIKDKGGTVAHQYLFLKKKSLI